MVEVSYGTSRLYGNPPGCVIVETIEHLEAAGLRQPTCFHLEQLAFLPWSEDFFGVHDLRSTPRMGRLPDALYPALLAATRR